uniref:U23-Theraphotoxin-Sfo1c_1 n=1 Tax=Selenotholus foelschei TaxID=1905327 RepID=A0A482Z7X5_9ARAC
MMRKILAVVFVLTLVACSNAERYSEADIEDSPVIQERICLASGKTCKGSDSEDRVLWNLRAWQVLLSQRLRKFLTRVLTEEGKIQ